MIRRLTAVAALVLACSAAFAGTAIEAANNQVRASVAYQKFDYVELDAYKMTTDGILDSERGHQPGVVAGITVQRDIAGVSKVYFSAEASRLRGNSAYTGYLQGAGVLEPYTATTKNTITEYQVRVGKGFVFAPLGQVQVTPYIAAGSYNWLRDSSEDDYGYAERYKHKFFAVGALAQYEVTPQLVASVDYQYGRTSSATMTIVADDTKFNLGAKPIQTLAVGVDYAVNKSVHVHANYRYNKFAYGESPEIDGFLEPSSKTKRDQIQFGIGYAF